MTLLAPSRADFPVLPHTGVAYLDSGATSQTPLPVIEAMDAYYREYRASIHRGIYPIAALATEAYETARDNVAAFAGSTPGETIFTRNATEAINLVAYSWGRANVGEGDIVVVTEMEHHSNLVPWQVLCQEKGAELAYVPIDEEGALVLREFERLLATKRVKLVAVAHISNVLGTLNPLDLIVAHAHAAGALVLIDGSQAVPQLPVNVGEIGADFYAWTAHKAYGPTGIGVLHGRREILEAMPPFITGGHMISSVGREQSRWAELPAKFEAGTSPIAEAVGLGAAVEFLQEIGMEAVRVHETDLTAYALERLAEIPGLTVHGPLSADRRGALVSFSVEGVHPHDVAEILGRGGVCVRAGHHCAQVLMTKLGVAATSRASFAIHNTRSDVDRLIDGLGRVKEVFA
jgi:cysteine desulfurase/selenocysteine lyase